MIAEKTSLESGHNTFSRADVISRIHIISGFTMQTELYEKLREELADTMIESMGLETVSKIQYMIPIGKFWPLQYGV